MGVTKNVSSGPVWTFKSAWMAWLLLTLLGLAFLQPLHSQPSPTYLEDFGLGLAVLFLSGVLLLLKGVFYVNRLLYVWLFFGVLLIVSMTFASLPFLSQLNMYGGFWLVGLGLTQLGAHFSWKDEDGEFTKALAWVLFITAFLSAVGGIVRLYGLGGVMSFYIPMPPVDRMIGLQGHTNYFAVLGFLGYLSACWLYCEGLIKRALLFLMLFFVFYGMVLSGTKVIYGIYLSVFVVSTLVCRRSGRFAFCKVLLISGICFLIFMPVVISLNLFISVWLKAHGFMPWGIIDGDIFKRGFDNSPRLVEWQLAWQIFMNALPWGVGPGGYPAASYAGHLQEGFVPVVGGLFTHSHNSYLQIIVEFGLAGVVWLLALGWIVFGVIQQAYLKNNILLLSVLVALLVYSFFEFPMWVMHFFVLLFLVVAAGQESTEKKGWRVGGGVVVVLTVLLGMHYGEIFRGMLKEHFSRFDGVSNVDHSYVNKMIKDPLLEHFGYTVYLTSATYQQSRIESDLVLLERFSRFLPFPAIMSRYSITLAGVGRKKEALDVLDELLKFDPEYAASFRDDVLVAQKMIPHWQLDFLLARIPAVDTSLIKLKGD